MGNVMDNAYIIGFVITWYAFAYMFLRRFGHLAFDLFEVLEAGVFGFFAGLLWPILWLGLFVGLVGWATLDRIGR